VSSKDQIKMCKINHHEVPCFAGNVIQILSKNGCFWRAKSILTACTTAAVGAKLAF
jgi:hypothetical protein